MNHAIAFLRSSGPLHYGRRLARLRWTRAIPTCRPVEVGLEEPALEALGGSDAWLIVREESALPRRLVRFPWPSPGRVLVAMRESIAGIPVHTLRELESAPPPPAYAGSPSGRLDPSPPAISFRSSDFLQAFSGTVGALLDHLLGGRVERELNPDFGAFSFGDASESERLELTRKIPVRCQRLLDVGCGTGGSAAAWRSRGSGRRATGIEKDEEAAVRAGERLDRVLPGDASSALERLGREGETFDAFLFADVLEHLEDPVKALGLARRLAVGGAVLVASVPNAGHLSLVRDLALGRFDPVPAGLADVGHLRWFTRASLTDALEESGWRVTDIEPWAGVAPPGAQEFLLRLGRWPGLDRESLGAYQWIAAAQADN